MRKGKKQNKADWLVGQWQADKGYMSVLFTIKKIGNRFHIKAVDESDGEELVVSRVNWDGKILSFETVTPSNKWRTRNNLEVISKNKAIHEITFWEFWEKSKSSKRN